MTDPFARLKFAVRVTNRGAEWFLKGTTWTRLESAKLFDTKAEAMAAIDRAKPFWPHKKLPPSLVTVSEETASGHRYTYEVRP